jgi:hypothetical protein
MRFDLRWKHALGMGLEDQGFGSTVLCRFRRKLLDHGLERALFERLVNAAREAGLILITKGAAQLLESRATSWEPPERETPMRSHTRWHQKAAQVFGVHGGEEGGAR